ncbi:MAG: hypothetical protein DHS20C01_32430 [marine bacterium B5-7]|nr:MAG: hypothetical protein DHS20C01_32430 [marine bacterium B5-7]
MGIFCWNRYVLSKASGSPRPDVIVVWDITSRPDIYSKIYHDALADSGGINISPTANNHTRYIGTLNNWK